MVGVSRAVLDEHEHFGLDIVRSAVVVHPTAAAAAAADDRSVSCPRTDGVPGTIGFLGRIGETKGLSQLLSAMRGSSQRLLVGGDGEDSYVALLKEQSGSNAKWLGWTDPLTFFRTIDLLVVPSVWKEPFGLVVIEAARAGVPVLIADHPGLVEAARAAGAHYATFTAGDEAALRAALGCPTSDYQVQTLRDEETDLVQLISGLASPGTGR
jgi:glycosyltransferase involved in cell wall biosynthesis